MMSSGRKLMAAAPPAASCALATRLMVTKLVKDCASGVVSRTVRTASAICSRSDGCVCGDIRVFGDSSLIIIAPYDGLDQQVQRVRRVAFLNSRTAAGSPALCPSTLWPNMDIVSCVSWRYVVMAPFRCRHALRCDFSGPVWGIQDWRWRHAVFVNGIYMKYR